MASDPAGAMGLAKAGAGGIFRRIRPQQPGQGFAAVRAVRFQRQVGEQRNGLPRVDIDGGAVAEAFMANDDHLLAHGQSFFDQHLAIELGANDHVDGVGKAVQQLLPENRQTG